MKEKKTEVIKTWPESVRDIQIFWSFANFYIKSIKNFSRIVTPLSLMLQTIKKVTEVGGSFSIKANNDKKNKE